MIDDLRGQKGDTYTLSGKLIWMFGRDPEVLQ